MYTRIRRYDDRTGTLLRGPPGSCRQADPPFQLMPQPTRRRAGLQAGPHGVAAGLANAVAHAPDLERAPSAKTIRPCIDHAQCGLLPRHVQSGIVLRGCSLRGNPTYTAELTGFRRLHEDCFARNCTIFVIMRTKSPPNSGAVPRKALDRLTLVIADICEATTSLTSTTRGSRTRRPPRSFALMDFEVHVQAPDGPAGEAGLGRWRWGGIHHAPCCSL